MSNCLMTRGTPLKTREEMEGQKMRIFKPSAKIREARLIKRLSEWHDVFAWLPVRVSHTELRWLCKVQRKGTFHTRLEAARRGMFPMAYWTWEYQAIY